MQKILITNDDGITANGLIRLCTAARKFGEVWVVAPGSQRSACSHSITIREPIDVYPFDINIEGIHAFKSTGTPADCVRVGCLNIMPGKPDIVLCGINDGYNCGCDLQYSATVGAALEASFQGIHAIALSEDFGEGHLVTDANLLPILEELINMPLSYGEIWNVNFPNCSLSDFNGIKRNCSVSHSSFFTDSYEVKEKLENNGIRLMVDGLYQEIKENGTDHGAVNNNYISIGKVRNLS